ncbi:hypothetical protein E2C01_098921 [Portunus trituberculatus]|uniref:Uncharacterized protein n=1 Tax=Portunus trituberculatus TaxID=210409 RepID=A0A5B7JYY4_PORTR|nr:hypothetical protein [Portunus trituberculatus]
MSLPSPHTGRQYEIQRLSLDTAEAATSHTVHKHSTANTASQTQQTGYFPPPPPPPRTLAPKLTDMVGGAVVVVVVVPAADHNPPPPPRSLLDKTNPTQASTALTTLSLCTAP